MCKATIKKGTLKGNIFSNFKRVNCTESNCFKLLSTFWKFKWRLKSWIFWYSYSNSCTATCYSSTLQSISTQNASFGCAVDTLNTIIGSTSYPGLLRKGSGYEVVHWISTLLNKRSTGCLKNLICHSLHSIFISYDLWAVVYWIAVSRVTLTCDQALFYK